MNHSLKIRGESLTVQVKHLDKNKLEVQIGEECIPVELIFTKNGKYIFKTPGKTLTTYVATTASGTVEVAINGLIYKVEDQKQVQTFATPSESGDHSSGQTNQIISPIPGKVVKIMVSEGDEVQKGQACMIVEAMKMENELTSPRDGKVAAVHVQEGDSVEAEKCLIELAE